MVAGHLKEVVFVALQRSAPRNSGATILDTTMKFRRYYAAVGCRSATTTTTH
jgi:hypothetical protein